MRDVVMCGLRLPKAPDDPLGPEQLERRTRPDRFPPELGQLLLGPGEILEKMAGGLVGGQTGTTAEVAQSFLDEETIGIYVAQVSAPTNKAGAGNGARPLSFHSGRLGRAVPDFIRWAARPSHNYETQKRKERVREVHQQCRKCGRIAHTRAGC